jgi:putative serine protease PepD
MLQTTDPRTDQWTPTPWATPAPPSEEPTPAPASGGDGGGGDGAATPERPREPHGPGWRGVLAVGAGAALLSSLLTGGTMLLVDHGSQTTTQVASAASSSASAAAPLVTSTGSQPNWAAVAAAIEPSVVTVQVQNGLGSGVILDKQGHILTNNHVVADSSGTSSGSSSLGSSGAITVVLSDGRSYAATIVGTDSATDLAVIKLTTVPSDLTPATLGDSSSVKVGAAVMAAGNPLGLSDTVTTGIVSAVNRPVNTTPTTTQQASPFGGQSSSSSSSTQQVVTNAIQTDAAINPGNSGGALVDTSGRVIGITSSIASLGSSGTSQSGSIGLGFAIPINQAKDVAQQLISTGTVKHAYLGVGLQDGTVTVNGAQRQAAVIRTVSQGTPAATAGLASGDAVIAINGQSVESSDSLIGTVRTLKPGDKVTLTVVRSGASRTVVVTVGATPTTSS